MWFARLPSATTLTLKRNASVIFIDNKYKKWYYAIVENAKNRPSLKNEYTEKHHIIPRCVGGDNSKSNLVILTAREHFICHLLLTKMFSDENKYKMLSAVTKFQQSRNYQKRILTSWQYKKIRECAIQARIGQKHSNETRKKIKDKHHDVSGHKNPRAKHVKAISPNGVVYHIHGNLKKFCINNKLGYSTVLRHISVHKRWNKKFEGSTKGWHFELMK